MVSGLREYPAEVQVGEGLADAPFGLSVVDGPLDTRDDVGEGTGARSVKHLDADEGGLLATL